jgi:hypothetical protein
VKKPAIGNVAASVHQRLLNIARETRRPFNELLQYFAMERLLYRLSRSVHEGSFVLKGALLFRVWDVPDSRATRDIDFLAFQDNSPEHLAGIFREICTIESNDGLVFDPDSVDARMIKEGAEYHGVRVRFRGSLGNARITLQADVGFGDIVHPGVVRADYPVFLDLPVPSLRMYPPETVVAEKVEAMIHLGSLNSRMKDFHDVWRLSRQFDFEPVCLETTCWRNSGAHSWPRLASMGQVRFTKFSTRLRFFSNRYSSVSNVRYELSCRASQSRARYSAAMERPSVQSGRLTRSCSVASGQGITSSGSGSSPGSGAG